MADRVPHVLRLWFGVTERVGPASYAASGLALAALKYGVEASLLWFTSSSRLMPWDFVNPLMSVREQQLRFAPDWLPWFLFVWTLPFLWIAVSMSVRRAADAGASPWLGLLVLVPLVNLPFMLAMCLVPGRPGDPWSPRAGPSRDERRAQSAALGIGAGVTLGGLMLGVTVYWLAAYGASLFLGTPLLMGAVAAYVHNRPYPRSYLQSVGVGVGAVCFAGVALLLFALEGVICVAMALPLLIPVGALGGVIGKAIADATRRPPGELLAAALALPLLAAAETLLIPGAEHEVMTAVEIDAPPEVVWRNVVDFPDLPEPDEWYFRLGIAFPERARIEGRGLGATRYCEFNTGTFVEPITAWDEPRRLAFDVTEQPAPMIELTPYRHVHPPHLDGFLRSTRGEFLLVPLPGGRTRLEGRTWYELDMLPRSYWTLWSDALIHRIHLRVLRHVQQLSEPPPER